MQKSRSKRKYQDKSPHVKPTKAFFYAKMKREDRMDQKEYIRIKILTEIVGGLRLWLT